MRKQKRRVFNVARVSVGQLAARPERHLHARVLQKRSCNPPRCEQTAGVGDSGINRAASDVSNLSCRYAARRW